MAVWSKVFNADETTIYLFVVGNLQGLDFKSIFVQGHYMLSGMKSEQTKYVEITSELQRYDNIFTNDVDATYINISLGNMYTKSNQILSNKVILSGQESVKCQHQFHLKSLTIMTFTICKLIHMHVNRFYLILLFKFNFFD